MLQVIRQKATEDSLQGSLYLNGAFVCFTLENIHKAIPCGVYTVENNQSPKFKRELPLIYNSEVKASRGIRFHAANRPEQLQGCIAIGMVKDVDYVGESSNAEKMVTMLCRNNTELVISEI